MIAAVLAALVAAGLVLRPEPELPGVARDPAPTVEELRFLYQPEPGEVVEVDLLPPPGEVMVVYFGYLSCPDVCPMTMADLRRARQLMGPERAGRTTVAFVSVDPARDDHERLEHYLGFFFDEGYMGLLAPDESVLDLATELLGVRYEIEEHDPGADTYDVAHSALTYVIDDTGTLFRELPFGAPAEDYARVIEAALDRPAT